MARPGVSYQAVHEAATTLQADGQSPTVQRVREHLGRGSHSTIAAHLRRFHGDHGQPVAPTPPTVRAAYDRLWEEALTAASEDFAAERRALAAREAELLADREDLLRRHQWLRVTLGERKVALADSQARCDTLETALSREREQRRMAEQTLHELRQQLATERQRTANAEAQLRCCQDGLLEQARDHQTQLQQQLLAQRQHAETQFQDQLLAQDRLRVTLDQARGQSEAARARAEARAEALQEQRHGLIHQRAVWESRCAGLSRALEASHREAEQCRRALDNARRVIIQLRERLARRSGRTTAPGGNGLQGGTTGGVDGH